MKNAIYTTFNENFLETGATMLYSFLNANPWYDGDILILYDDGENCPFSEENMKKIRKLSEKIKFNKINSKEYSEISKNFPLYKKKYHLCLYKLEMFKKNDDYDVKFYIDADVCFCQDVKELFDIYITDEKAFLCRDICSSNCCSLGIDKMTENDYANLGFMLLNCKKISDDEYSKIFELCSKIKMEDFKNLKSSRGLYGEQDFFNDYLKDAILLPEIIYNCNPRFYNERTKIIHYYGEGRKPWDCSEVCPAFNEFYKNYFFATKIINS